VNRHAIIRSLAFLILASAASPEASEFDPARFSAFMDVAAKFERKLYGCPPDAWEGRQCSPELGQLDVKLKAQVWKRGKELFGGQ
jgi:hypothetical protein